MKFDELKFDELFDSVNNVNNPFLILAEAFKDLQDYSHIKTKYKCPECSSDLYVYMLLEDSVIFYCKNCDKKVKGLL